MDKLTQKQYDFTVNYIKNGFNAYQAALDAGYSQYYATSQAPKLLDHPDIKPRIIKAYERAEQVLNITVHDKAKYLLRILDDVMPIDGEPKRNYYAVAIKAINELNKMQGDYAPEKRLSMTVDATQGRLIDARKQYDEY